MCKFCLEHGEGKKWYLQSKNYAEELLTEERKAVIKGLLVDYEKSLADMLLPLGQGLAKDPATTRSVLIPTLEEQLEAAHHGQVVLVEEVQQIFDMATNVVRMFCACRSQMQGKYHRLCYGVATFKSDFLPSGFIEPYPDYSQNLEVLTPEEAKKEVVKFDHQGMVHTVWTIMTPFITTICNCTRKDCLALRARLETGANVVWKGEYFATIEPELCNGCRDCRKVCNFGAIAYSNSLEKAYVNSLLCYGCGLCRAVCTRDAVSMNDRNTVTALANLW